MRPSCNGQHDELRSCIVTILLITAAFVSAWVYDPASEPILTLCLFRKWTGLPCPGCGMTRSFCALAKGHWQQSLSFHPLGPAAFGLFAAAWVRALLLLLSRAVAGRQISGALRALVNWVDQLPSRLRLFQIGFFLLLLVWGVRLGASAYSGRLNQLFGEGLLSKSLWFLWSRSSFE